MNERIVHVLECRNVKCLSIEISAYSLFLAGQLLAREPELLSEIVISGVGRRRRRPALLEVAARDASQIGTQQAVQRCLFLLPARLNCYINIFTKETKYVSTFNEKTNDIL